MAFPDDDDRHWRETPKNDPEWDEPPVISAHMMAPGADFEKGMSTVPVVTIVLIVLCTAIFVVEAVRGALFDLDKLLRMGALHRPEVARGEIWRLISAMFLHGSFDHLLGNVLMFYILGMAGEHAYGRLQFLVLYVAAGLAGSLCSLAGNLPSVGASGAIFGVAGSMIVFFFRYRHQLHLRDKRIGAVLAMWAGYQIVLGFLTPGVDNLAHLGGAAGGVVLGFLLRSALLEGRLQTALHPLVLAGFVLSCAALAATAVFFVPRLLA